MTCFFKKQKEKNVGEEGDLHRKLGSHFFRERVSSFSLSFCAIRPLAVVGTRGKAALRIEAYAWVPVLWVFEKIQEVGIFPYLGLFFV